MTMRQTVFPFSIVISSIGEQIKKVEFDTLPLSDVRHSYEYSKALLSRMKIYLILGLTSINCLTAFANLGSGASPSRVLKSVMEVLSQLFLTPQQDSQYACPIQLQSQTNVIQYCNSPYFQFLQTDIKQQVGTMQNLVSLPTQGHLLDINTNNNSLNHLIICDTLETANQTVQSYIGNNRECISVGQITDNIVKLEINNVAILSAIESEIDKISIIKKLLTKIQEKSNKSTDLIEGFYFINACSKTIQFYKVNSMSGITKGQPNSTSILDLFVIFVYLLEHSSDIKDYLTAWKKIYSNKSQFKPTLKNNSKIDQLLLSILNKQVMTTKIAHHTIEIMIEKINWMKSSPGQHIPIKQKFSSANHAQFKLNFNQLNQKQTRRLKHSNSMTNLSSSSKARKYKQVSKHAKQSNEKIIKQRQFRNQSFKNTNQSINFQPNQSSHTFTNSKVVSKILDRSTKNTFFGSSKFKETATKQYWYKEDVPMSSFVQVNEQCMQNSINAQNQLLDLLERKNKMKKQPMEKNETKYCGMKVSNQALSIGETILRPKKQLKFCSLNLNVQVQRTRKPANLRFVPEIFSHVVASKQLCCPEFKASSQNVKQNHASNVNQMPKLKKETREDSPNISQISEIESLNFQVTNKILSSKNQPKPPQPETVNNKIIVNEELSNFDKNSGFIYESVRIFAEDIKQNRQSWLICTYIINLFYYLCCYPATDYQVDEMEKHIQGIKILGEAIKKRKAGNSHIKAAYEKDVAGDLNSLVGLSTDIPTVQSIKPQHTNCQTKAERILRNETYLLMDEVKKAKDNLMKKDMLKPHLLYIMRIAVVIQVSRNLYGQNQLIRQFEKYGEVIEHKAQYSINLDEEFKNVSVML